MQSAYVLVGLFVPLMLVIEMGEQAQGDPVEVVGGWGG